MAVLHTFSGQFDSALFGQIFKIPEEGAIHSFLLTLYLFCFMFSKWFETAKESASQILSSGKTVLQGVNLVNCPLYLVTSDLPGSY